MQLFTPNHVKLLVSCYPPASALPTAGPDYAPNSHELSRLTYYASNNPGKLTKIGSELDKRLKAECRKAKSGNIRSRASLLISLSIFRSLATECRRDIALLSPALISSAELVLGYLSEDLEVAARAASVFTTWTTYTNGHLIGADSTITNEYFSILKQFSSLSAYISSDKETQNRTRLIGLAALTAALNSDALYNDIRHFGVQVATIIRPVLVILFETSMSTLDDQATVVKDSTFSPYLAEFRTRPTLERRAVSIHAHVDGDQGPSVGDVSDAALHALFSLVSHTNSAQLGLVMQSTFDCLDKIQGWKKLDHCCWYAQKIAEWAQYQYRHAVPTWLVERLLTHQDTSSSTPVQRALTAMITSVFSSSTPFINLSSSDIMSNLLTLLLRCISVNAEDPILSSLVECISSLGCHVYYSDQIQDLANELINRLVLIEVQGILVADKSPALTTRSAGIHYLLESLVGLIRAANTHQSSDADDEAQRASALGLSTLDKRTSIDRHSRRTRVPPDIWQDTLSLLCDADLVVRRECAMALVYYLTSEMPKHHELCDIDGQTRPRKVDTPFRQLQNTFPNAGDAASKFLNAVHAYAYILAISPTLHNTTSLSESPEKQSLSNVNGGGDAAGSDEQHEHAEIFGHVTPQNENSRRSYISQNGSRARKESLVLKLLEKAPARYNTPAQASEEDYATILKIFTAIHVHLPMHGLLTGVPMLLALDIASETNRTEGELLQRIVTIKTVITHVWLILAQVWKIQELVIIAEQAINNLTSLSKEEINSSLDSMSLGIDADTALTLIVSSRSVQDAFKLDRDNLVRRLSNKWTPELALRDFEKSSGFENTLRGDGVSPLLKISPALMHIENISLQSLARSTRGLGVTDLREALEGRSGMSNPTLTRPPSVSTLDHASSFASGDAHNLRLTQTRSRSRAKKHPHPNGANEVRDVLSRLGISKQSGSLLKATFPVRQKS